MNHNKLHFHISTFPHFHIPTFPHFHISTFPHSHIPTFPHFHISTFPHLHINTFPHYSHFLRSPLAFANASGSSSGCGISNSFFPYTNDSRLKLEGTRVSER